MTYQDNNTTAEKSETWTANSYQRCANRLPCGVCRLMQMPCPLGVNSYRTDFNKVTCKETGNLTTTLQSLSNTEVQE